MQRSPLKRKTQLRPKKPMKRSGRSKPTAEQQRYHEQVREVGCIVSGRKPVALHHVRDGLGMGQKVDHWRVIPLHYDFHQSEAAGAISLHGSPKEFIEAYGSESGLEHKLKMILEE